MTNDEARVIIAGLDGRYRHALRQTDEARTVEDWYFHQPEAKKEYAQVVGELNALRAAHPHLFECIEAIYRLACSKKRRTKSMWPKRGAQVGQPPTTQELLNFGYEENLTILGEPTTYFSPNE